MPPTTPTTFAELVTFVIGIINSLILLLVGLAFVVTMWNIVNAWIIHADNETKRAEGKQIAFTSVAVMVVMLSVWGILSLLKNSLF
ncbi:MAG: hypothetical protein KBD44_02145 [Candidatus Pacebacteria bacterium]|jgi:hypothetical protein|nr:hypothetical protein [Candidatus Paceibacterota bacterium]